MWLLAIGTLLVFALILATGIAVHRRREAERLSETKDRLREVSDLIRKDWRSRTRLRLALTTPPTRSVHLYDVERGLENGPFRDGWGRPFLCARPGPVHRHGWDLWSVGPNGIDEQGNGDDILVGENVADIGSPR
ncbi:MAG TPA: hypothetical protein VFF73_31735 [Planctomycetota bacterium]|nr:hypothetical protein [Planctomycetota bacterium]